MRQNLSLADLRRVAMAFEGDTLTQTRYGSMVDLWINEGQMKMVGELGIQDTWLQTSQPNRRAYPLPLGWAKIKIVLFNGTPLRFCSQIDQDFFDAGTTYCDRYSIWDNQLFLGAQPPNAAFPIRTNLYREPNLLVNDGDIPEVPNRFRMALAHYGAAMQVLASAGDNPMVQMLLEKFEEGRKGYFDWIDGQSTENLQVRNVTDGPSFWGR